MSDIVYLTLQELTKISDEELVRIFQQQNSYWTNKILNELFRRYHLKLTRITWRVYKKFNVNFLEPNDLIHVHYSAIQRVCTNFKPQFNFAAQVCVVARSAARDYIRKYLGKRDYVLNITKYPINYDILSTIHTDNKQVNSWQDLVETEHIFMSVQKILLPIEKTILDLKKSGCSNIKIAQKLKISPTQVAKIFQNLLLKVSKYLSTT